MIQSSIHFGSQVASGKPRLLLSFSFGRSSAYMAKHCLDHLADQYEMRVVAANTGQERDESLLFGHQCDTHFGFNSTWVEAEINQEHGGGTRHRVVTYETATRLTDEAQPFEAMIQKYGIPGPGRPHCTRELKANAIRSYLLSIGWDDYTIAIGIRPDEPRRVDEEQMRRANLGQQVKFIYPLIDFFYADKQDVNDWWEDQPFNLKLKEHEGNCAWCWKKSFSKHARQLADRPGLYEFPARMEAMYPRVGPEFVKRPDSPVRVFFRQNTPTIRLAQVAAELAPAERAVRFAAERPDENAGCGESCEPYPMLTGWGAS